jgi:hypothetical protein
MPHTSTRAFFTVLEMDGVTGHMKQGSWDALAQAEYLSDRSWAFRAKGGVLSLVRSAVGAHDPHENPLVSA